MRTVECPCIRVSYHRIYLLYFDSITSAMYFDTKFIFTLSLPLLNSSIPISLFHSFHFSSLAIYYASMTYGCYGCARVTSYAPYHIFVCALASNSSLCVSFVILSLLIEEKRERENLKTNYR